ncbi:MAG: hypothetical protein ACKPDI_03935 [Actinomycetota bacterium]
MPFAPRLRLPRRRQPSHRLSANDHEFSVLVPPPDEPILVPSFREAVMLAMDIRELPVQHEALLLLDERRHVAGLLLDPPAEVGLLIGAVLPDDCDLRFSQTIDIVLRDTVAPGPPDDHDREGFEALRRIHLAQGLLLMDVLITDGDNVRSMAIACEPEPIWFEEFDPHPYDPGA